MAPEHPWIALLLAAVVVIVPALVALSLIALRRLGFGMERRALGQFQAHVDRLARDGVRFEERGMRGKVFLGECGGTPFEHWLLKDGKNAPTRACVAIPVSAPGELELYPESTGTALAKGLRMVDEFQSGDAALDRKVYFSGTTDEYVRAVFGVRTNLDTVRSLLDLKFDRLTKEQRRLVASCEFPEPLQMAQIAACVGQLSRLVLPGNVPGAGATPMQGRTALYALRIALLVIGVTGLTGFLTSAQLVEGWGAFWVKTLPLTALLSAAVLSGAWWGLRGRSMAVGGLVELLIYFPLLVVSLIGVLGLANQRLDGSAEITHHVSAQHRHQRTIKRSVEHYVAFDSWRGRAHQTLAVEAHVYHLAGKGTRWAVRTRRGWLGHEWLVSIEPLP